MLSHILVCVWVSRNAALNAQASSTQQDVGWMRDEFTIPPPLLMYKPDSWVNRLENTTLKVLVHEMMPYTRFAYDSNGAHLTGYIGEIWKVLEGNLGFRSKYRRVLFSEGKEILREGDADVMLSPVVLESKDLDIYDNIGPIASSVYTLYVKAPEDRGSSSSYLSPWSSDLWMSYLAMHLFCILLLWVTSKIRNHFGLDDEVKKKERVNIRSKIASVTRRFSFWNCVLVVLGYATQQDVQVRTKACSLRMLLVVLLLFNFMMISSYNSTLVSRMTVGSSNFYFNNLESIPDSPTPFLCVRTNSAVYSMFQVNSSSKELQPVWKNVVNKGPCHPNPLTPSDIAANICKERCVVFESSNIMSTLLARGHDCDMVRLRVKRVYSLISLLLRKGFKHREEFQFAIVKMKNSGVMQLLEDRFLIVKGSFFQVPKFQEVTLGHVKVVVVVYGNAVILSILILFLELGMQYKLWRNTNLEKRIVKQQNK